MVRVERVVVKGEKEDEDEEEMGFNVGVVVE